jgi:hypothetical protein
VLVDGHGDRLHARPGSSGPGRTAPIAGILEGHAPDAGLDQDTQHQVEPLGDAGAHHQPVGLGGGGADAAQVAGQHLPEDLAASRVAVVEGRGGGVAQALTLRPQPVGPREAGQVGRPGGEVGQQSGRGGGRHGGQRRGVRGGLSAYGRHPGGGADLRGPVPEEQQAGDHQFDLRPSPPVLGEGQRLAQMDFGLRVPDQRSRRPSRRWRCSGSA